MHHMLSWQYNPSSANTLQPGLLSGRDQCEVLKGSQLVVPPYRAGRNFLIRASQ